VRRPPDHADLSPAALVVMLTSAYASGAFPMADPRTGAVDFYTTDPRALVPLDDRFHTPRTVERDLRRGRFELTTDEAFEQVVRGCAAPRRRAEAGDAWLSERLIEWATLLHQAGRAHSLEAWRRAPGGERVLAGGIYGVSIGAAFFGESMFHRPRPRLPDGSRDPLDGTGASSACLVALQRHLRACGYQTFDAQVANPHTERFGLIQIPLHAFIETLEEAVGRPDAWRPLAQTPEQP
jgi:leucyl/phenylalanyl-tRNA--protein transferase